MHELSLANEICHIIEREVLRDRGVGALAYVTMVAVEVGHDANVEPSSLQFCLDTLLAIHPFGRGSALIDRVPGDDLRVAWFEIDDDAAAAAPCADPATSRLLETSP